MGPESTIDGDEIERRVVAVLEASGIPYELHRIDPAFADTAEYCDKYGRSPEHAANTIVVGAAVVAGLSHPV